MIKRETSFEVILQFLQISDVIAQESMHYFNNHKFMFSSAAKILLGFNIRENLRGIDALVRTDLDSQAYILYRTLYENYVSFEYVSKTTIRGSKRLTPAHKGFLFVTFPAYKHGLHERVEGSERIQKRVTRRRRLLVKDDRYWHGASLRTLGDELDNLRHDGTKPYAEQYSELYGNLSFITHPNSRDATYFEEDPLTQQLRLIPSPRFDAIGFFATLWAIRSLRRWASVVKSTQIKAIDDLADKMKAILRAEKNAAAG